MTADSKTKTFGSVDPTFTTSFAGFVNGETPAVLGGALGFSRATREGIGTYTITPSGLASQNYEITFNTGTLTIIAPPPVLAPPLITATNVIVSWTA